MCLHLKNDFIKILIYRHCDEQYKYIIAIISTKVYNLAKNKSIK